MLVVVDYDGLTSNSFIKKKVRRRTDKSGDPKCRLRMQTILETAYPSHFDYVYAYDAGDKQWFEGKREDDPTGKACHPYYFRRVHLNND